MYKDLKQDLAQAVVPVSGVDRTGYTARVSFRSRRLGLEQVFVEGSASEQTMKGPGLQPDSRAARPAGLSILVGRRATFGAPFAHLDETAAGDIIVVTTGQGRFEYVVDIVRTTDAPAHQDRGGPGAAVAGDLGPGDHPDPLSSWSPPSSTARLSRPRRAPRAPPDNSPARAARATLVALLLWSQLLLVVTCAFTWAALSVPGRALWIGAVPVFIAILWNVFENLAVLLPNTL